MMILLVDIVNIQLLIPKYHDNYILKYIFQKILVYIYRYNRLIINYFKYHNKYIDIKINKLNNNIN